MRTKTCSGKLDCNGCITCARCLANLLWDTNQFDHMFRRGEAGDREREAFMKRVDKSKVGGTVGKGLAAEDARMQREYPNLYQHLTSVSWEDGKPRTPSSISVFCEDGLFKACLNNKAESLVAFCSADGFTGLLAALERSLEEDTVEWRKAKPFKK